MRQAIAQDASLSGRLHRIAAIFWSGRLGDYQAMRHDAMRHLPREHAMSLGATIYRSVIEPVEVVMLDAAQRGELPAATNHRALTHLYWAFVDGIASAYQRGDALSPPDTNIGPIALFVAGAKSMDMELLAKWPAAPRS